MQRYYRETKNKNKDTSANKKSPLTHNHETEEHWNGVKCPQAKFCNMTKHLDSEIQKCKNGQNKKKCKPESG